VAEQKKLSWKKFHEPILEELNEATNIIRQIGETSAYKEQLEDIEKELKYSIDPMRKDVFKSVSDVLMLVKNEKNEAIESLKKWRSIQTQINEERYSSYQHTNSLYAPTRLPIVQAQYEERASVVSGYQVLNACFDTNFARDPKIVAFGEDVGKIGDVNQAFAGCKPNMEKNESTIPESAKPV
jgi:2-oxoisovalerate dehydrogenase E1 component